MTTRTARHQRGMSMIELIMVLVLIAAAAAIATPSLTGFRRSGDDTLAKLYLTTTIDAEAFHHTRTGAFTEVTDATPNPLPRITADAAGALTLITGNSTPSSEQVSAAISADGTTLGLATKPGDTCWYAIRFANATGSSPTTLYAYGASPDSICTGDQAITLPATLNLSSGFGRTPGSPAIAP